MGMGRGVFKTPFFTKEVGMMAMFPVYRVGRSKVKWDVCGWGRTTFY